MELKPGYKQTEVGVIPEDWEVQDVQNIGQIRTGPFGTLLKADEYSHADGTPLISVGEIGEGTLRVNKNTPLVPPSVVRRLPEYILNCGDIVFGRKGAVDRSALVNDSQSGWFLGSDGIRIRPFKTFYPPFIACQFQRKEVQAWLLQNATGTTMASLNQEILRRVSLPIPPLPEQRAIAQSLSDVDALIAALDQLITKKRNIKQGTMQQLLTGKKRLPGFSGEWKMKRVGDICDFIVPGRNKPRNFEGDIPWITTPDLKDGRSVSKSRLGLCISRDEAQNVGSKIVPAGSVIMSCAGELGIVALTKNEIVINQQLHAFIPSSIDLSANVKSLR